MDLRIIFLFLASVTICINWYFSYIPLLSILPSFHSYNSPICNILIFENIAFGYDFNFWLGLTYGLTVLQKGLKIGPSDCIQMSKTSELPGTPPPWHPLGALPLDPTRVPTAAPGPHADSYSAHYALTILNCLSPHFKKQKTKTKQNKTKKKSSAGPETCTVRTSIC